MSPEQRKIVVDVYNHLISKEERPWGALDDFLEYLGFLSDDEVYREADVINEIYSRNHSKENPQGKFIPYLIEASSAISELYMETNSLHTKNRYILQYLIAMHQADLLG